MRRRVEEEKTPDAPQTGGGGGNEGKAQAAKHVRRWRRLVIIISVATSIMVCGAMVWPRWEQNQRRWKDSNVGGGEGGAVVVDVKGKPVRYGQDLLIHADEDGGAAAGGVSRFLSNRLFNLHDYIAVSPRNKSRNPSAGVVRLFPEKDVDAGPVRLRAPFTLHSLSPTWQRWKIWTLPSGSSFSGHDCIFLHRNPSPSQSRFFLQAADGRRSGRYAIEFCSSHECNHEASVESSSAKPIVSHLWGGTRWACASSSSATTNSTQSSLIVSFSPAAPANS